MMMTGSKKALSSLALLCGLGWLVMACPASLDDFCADGACGPRVTAGEGGTLDGGNDGGDGGPMTDPCIDDPTALPCLDESKALFVSNPNGNDQDPAAGTRKVPFKTINAALAKIDAKRRRIYVCEGAYFEDISLTAAHSSLSIFGGIDCAWNAAPGVKPVIGATANPLKIDGTAALAIADIAVVAKDATTGSSIAAFVNGGDTTFKRVNLAAGKGADATDAILVPFTNLPVQTDLKGGDSPDTMTGGAGGKYACRRRRRRQVCLSGWAHDCRWQGRRPRESRRPRHAWNTERWDRFGLHDQRHRSNGCRRTKWPGRQDRRRPAL
jgi:hypothetical protein